MSTTIAVASGKGGVGKSTVVCGLGTVLANQGKKVLLMDMDQGLRSLDLMLNISDGNIFDLSDIIDGHCKVLDAVKKVEETDSLFLIPAPSVAGAVADIELMKKLISKLQNVFDYILLDCPAGIDHGFDVGTSVSDNVLVVVTPDPVSVRDGSVVNQVLIKKKIKNRRLIINKIDTKLMRNGIYLNIDEIIDQTGIQLIAAIPTDTDVNICLAKRKLLLEGYAHEAFKRLSLRLQMENIPIPNLTKIS